MANQQNAQPEPIDADPQETREWIEALDGVIAQEGADRAHFLIEKVIGQAREAGIDRYQGESLRLFKVLDGHLKDHEFLAGDYSIADIVNWGLVRYPTSR